MKNAKGLTMREVAERFGCSPRIVMRAIRDGMRGRSQLHPGTRAGQGLGQDRHGFHASPSRPAAASASSAHRSKGGWSSSLGVSEGGVF